MPANIKSNGVDLDNIFFARQTTSLSDNTNVQSNGVDLTTQYMPLTDSSVINPGSQISSTDILTSSQPYPVDSEYGLVQVLLPMNGSNGSTTFNDASKNNFSPTSVGVELTISDYRFGGSSASFGNYSNQNYINIGSVNDLEPFWYFGPQDWCVEFWVKDSRALSPTNYHSVFTIGLQSGLSYSGITLGYTRSSSNGYIFPEWWFDSTAVTPGLFADFFQYNAWNHFAFTNTAGKYRVYINGVNPIRDGVAQLDYFFGVTSEPQKDYNVRIGHASSFAGTPGLIDDLRITIGSSRYTKNFSVSRFPCQRATYDYSTANIISSLLVNFEGINGSTNFADASYNSKTLTAVGDATISTDQYKFGISSGYFSGSSYVSLPSSADFNFGTEDFTIEAWIYPVGSTISNSIRLFRMNSGTSNDYTFEISDSSTVKFFAGLSGASTEWSASITTNSWNHVSFTRYNGVLYAFLNGQKLSVKSGSPVNTLDIQNTEFNSFPAGIQGSTTYPSSECYIDNLVITKKIAKYIDSFTTPQLPSSFGPNDVGGLFATKLNMTGLSAPSNTSVTQTGWSVPTDGIIWTHTVTATFNSNTDLNSFFNYGGEIYIYPSYNPKGVGVDEYLYTLLDRVPKITIGGDYTNKAYSWGTLSNPNIGGANVGTTPTQLFSYSYSTDGSGLNSTYTVTLAANAASGSSTVLTITTALSLPRVSVFTYSNTYSSLIKYRYSTLALQPTFVGTLTNNIPPPASVVANFTSNVTSGINPLIVNFTDTSTGSPTNWLWDFTNGVLIDNSPSPKTITAYNAVASVNVVKYGTGSLSLSGPGSELYIPYSSDLSFESTDWTIEGWIYRVNNSETYSTILDFRGNAAYNTSWGPYIDNSNRTFNIYDGTIFSTPISTPINSVPDFNNWFHYAIVRSGTTTTIYINGVSQASATWNAPPTNSSGVRIGLNQAAQAPFSGYMDEIRLTKGVARYTTNFTPPTQAFPDNSSDPYYSNVSLLLHFDSISTAQNPSYVYSDPGTYSVKLTASKSGSTDTVTKTNYITVNQSGIMKLTIDTSKAGSLGKQFYLPIQSSILIDGSTISTPYNVSIDWGDGTVSGNGDPLIHTYTGNGIYQITITGKITAYGIESGAPQSLIDMLVSVDQWDNDLGLQYLTGAFAGAKNLISIPNTLPTTVISTMFAFANCDIFNHSNITLWNMTNVTDIRGMFINTLSFNQPIGSWNVSNVTKMVGLFGRNSSGSGPTIFNQNISTWNTQNVTNMNDMFNGNSAFNQNIGSWDVSNVTSMDGMFNAATSFNQDLTGWCVQNILSLPTNFASNGSGLQSSNFPIWGTCPP